MRDGRDTVHIEGLAEAAPDPSGPAPGAPAARPWIGILFRCCSVYARIYRDPAQPVYRGCCPRCGAQVTARVGPGGTSQRLFSAQ